jgi:hypothetical protein
MTPLQLFEVEAFVVKVRVFTRLAIWAFSQDNASDRAIGALGGIGEVQVVRVVRMRHCGKVSVGQSNTIKEV